LALGRTVRAGVRAADAGAAVVAIFARFDDPIPAPTGGRSRAAVKGVVYTGDDLIHGDFTIAVHIARGAGGYLRRPERNVHHGDELIDRDFAVAVAIAGAHRLCASGRDHDEHRRD